MLKDMRLSFGVVFWMGVLSTAPVWAQQAESARPAFQSLEDILEHAEPQRLRLWDRAVQVWTPLQKQCFEGYDELVLSDITHLSGDEMDLVSMFVGHCLLLDGLQALEVESAQRLRPWSGKVLSLDGLKRLAPEALESLSEWRGEVLSLSGLETLNAEQAERLSAWKGRVLYLGGLWALEVDAARHLANFSGTLRLDKFWRVEPDAARQLCSNDGLTETCRECAQRCYELNAPSAQEKNTGSWSVRE